MGLRGSGAPYTEASHYWHNNKVLNVMLFSGFFFFFYYYYQGDQITNLPSTIQFTTVAWINYYHFFHSWKCLCLDDKLYGNSQSTQVEANFSTFVGSTTHPVFCWAISKHALYEEGALFTVDHTLDYYVQP